MREASTVLSSPMLLEVSREDLGGGTRGAGDRVWEAVVETMRAKSCPRWKMCSAMLGYCAKRLEDTVLCGRGGVAPWQWPSESYCAQNHLGLL